VNRAFRILILFFGVFSGLFIIQQTRLLDRISTDVTDLISRTDGNRELQVLAKLRREQSDFLFVRIDGPDSQVAQASREMVEALEKFPEVDQLSSGLGPADPDAALKVLLNERFSLLFPARLAELQADTGSEDPAILASTAVDDLEEFLSRPESSSAEEILIPDPLLLVVRGMEIFSAEQRAVRAEVIWAQLSESSFKEEFREVLLPKIRSLEESVERNHPEVSVEMTGSLFFSEVNVRNARAEVIRINVLSLLGIVLLVWLSFPRPLAVLHLIVLIMLAFLGGAAAVAVLCESPHILAFVIGSVLSGICVDYGLHILITQTKSGHQSYSETLQKIRKPLLGSALSTIAGFLLMCFSEVALLQETGIFVAAGLSTALIVCWLYFPLFRPGRKGRAAGSALMDRLRPRIGSLAFRRRLGFAFVILLAISGIAGLLQWKWEDKAQQLNVPDPDLQERREFVLRGFGMAEDQHSYLSHGDSFVNAIEEQEQFAERASAAGNEEVMMWSSFFPTRDQLDRSILFANEGAADFASAFREELEKREYDPEIFEPFFASFRDQMRPVTFAVDVVDSSVRALDEATSGPSSFAFHSEPGMGWVVSRVEEKVQEEAVPPASVIDRNESIDRILTQYRNSFIDLSVPALLVVMAILVVAFRVDGLIAAGISVVSIAVGLGLALLFFGGLNLFSLTGAFVGFCLALDYTLFARLSPERDALIPNSVFVSAITSGLSFLVLSTSAIEAVQCLGVTVVGSIAMAVLLLAVTPKAN